MSRHLQPVGDLPFCPECGELECDCAELIQRVDPEDIRGFNPVSWARTIRDARPIRLDPNSGALWSYSGGVWREDRSIIADLLPLRMGKSYRRYKHLETISDRIRAELKDESRFISPDKPDDNYVSLPSGLFDFTNGEVIPHDPDLSVICQLSVDPVFSAETPEFDKFLADVLHPGDIDRVLDILAYLLRPGNPLQRAVMLTGTGRNGKSVLLNLIESISGRENMATVPLQRLSARFSAARLYAKSVNMVGEIDGGHVDNTSAFKQMTGGDLLEMDVKHSQPFSAHVWAVPVFSANQIPTSSDTSEGYLRRWEIIEFPNTFDGSDTTIEARLFAERAAIAGKLLRRAAATGFTIRRSTPGDAAREAFATRSDPVRAWLADGEMLPVGFAPRTRTYDCYKLWIEDGNGKQALTRNKFYERVAAVLGPAKTVQGVRGWDFPGPPT